jgi:signal transduction histidine kinase
MYTSVPPTQLLPSRKAADISQLCQLQLQQLSLQIPLLRSQIVYWDHAKTKQVVYLGKKQWQSFEAETLDALLPGKLTIVETRSDAVSSICTFGQCNYLLLWTESPLSPGQQTIVEQQVLILEHYFQLHEENRHQQSAIHLLEQILLKAEHQLRNPLALVSLYAENLYLGLSAEAQKQQVALIRETTAKLSESISNLMACGQQAKVCAGAHLLLDLVQEAAADLQPWLKEKQIRLCCPDSSLSVTVDRWQFQQVLHNLLHNAVQFSPIGGTITCEWQIYQGEVLITIADQGVGLSEADLQQMFAPFYSRRSGGTGMGLAIARKIILDHHGSLWAENLAIGGAQFSISLPN